MQKYTCTCQIVNLPFFKENNVQILVLGPWQI